MHRMENGWERWWTQTMEELAVVPGERDRLHRMCMCGIGGRGPGGGIYATIFPPLLKKNDKEINPISSCAFRFRTFVPLFSLIFGIVGKVVLWLPNKTTISRLIVISFFIIWTCFFIQIKGAVIFFKAVSYLSFKRKKKNVLATLHCNKYQISVQLLFIALNTPASEFCLSGLVFLSEF